MASASRYLSIPLPNGSRISLILSLPFGIIHLASLLISSRRFNWYYLVTCLALLVVRMFFRDRGLSPLFFAPLVQDQPRFPVCDRLHGHDLFAEGRALVGGASSPPSPAFRPGAGFAFSDAISAFSGRTSVGLSPTNTTTRGLSTSATSQSFPSCAG